MNTDTYSTETPATGFQQGMTNRVEDIKAKASDKLVTLEDKVRTSPDKAILIALGAGYALHFLPKRSLLAAPIKIAALLAKPALLGLGAYKACELAQKK